MRHRLDELQQFMDTNGIHKTLRMLNARTPHRFTSIYRFDGAMLRNEHLFDQFNPEVLLGDDVPMENAYCALVEVNGGSLEFADGFTDERFTPRRGSCIVSYCGVLIRDLQGKPYGTLCHYDFKSCQKRAGDVPLLEAVAPVLFRALASTDLPGQESSASHRTTIRP